jgi:hypothetical protein
MTHSPPASPAPQNTPLRTAGDGNRNPNYVRNGQRLIRRRDAVRLIERGRAEWVNDDEIRLTERSATDRGYDEIRDQFQPYRGQSDGFAIRKARRVTGGRS